jgi:hypothetical protein
MAMKVKYTLSSVDYVVFVGSLVLSLTIGVCSSIRSRHKERRTRRAASASVESTPSSSANDEAEDLVMTKGILCSAAVFELSWINRE